MEFFFEIFKRTIENCFAVHDRHLTIFFQNFFRLKILVQKLRIFRRRANLCRKNIEIFILRKKILRFYFEKKILRFYFEKKEEKKTQTRKKTLQRKKTRDVLNQ